ncbi:transcription initiation factor IID, TAF10 subunit [Eremomyces bilateralis CBS 781.70]|uniref:Transcription initiation factor IID, TAF10 subunit n=1 Tax=Eremomyces bilateralis CBS 781.70 TaxID=1392243 RepID=A0A6G1GGV7_9PEZI|nr:transcription initiation factor IID, TAF10 subunit [Eremomyces bilateralis CBS 781.70]KAF1817222.1 transcription initiation factor IID, TAF10 subunit [Eremomyces bilateralis CBS 781.70]
MSSAGPSEPISDPTPNTTNPAPEPEIKTEPTQQSESDNTLVAPADDADAEPSLDATQPDPMNLDGGNDVQMNGTDERNGAAPLSAAPAGPSGPRIAQKKDVTLRDFLGKMDDYAPIIPDAVINYYLTLAGLPPPPQTPPHLARLLGLATQKFIADIAADSYQYSRIRSSNTTSNNPMQGLGGVATFGTTAGGPSGPGAAQGQGGGKDAPVAKAANLGVQRPGYGGGGQGGASGRTVLTMEDLGMAEGGWMGGINYGLHFVVEFGTWDGHGWIPRWHRGFKL